MSTQKKTQREIFSLDSVIKIVKDRWIWFLISIILFGALGVTYALVKPKYYEVDANVVISQDSASDNMLSEVSDLGVMFGNNGNVDDEIFIISSHAVYKQVAKNLGANQLHWVRDGLVKEFMYKGYPVGVYPQPGIEDTLRRNLVFKIKVDDKERVNVKVKYKYHTVAKIKNATFPVTLDSPYGTFIINKTAAFVPGESVNEKVMLMSYDNAAEFLADNVKASIASRRSNVISLSMLSSSPSFAKDVLNNIIEEYNQRGIEMSNLKNKKTEKFIDDRLNLVFNDLAETESKIQQYKESEGGYSLISDIEYNYKVKSEIEQKLFHAKTTDELLNMTKDFLEDPENKYELVPTSLAGEGDVETPVEKYNNLLLGRIRLMQNAKSGNKSLEQTEKQIDMMRVHLISSLNNAIEQNNMLLADLEKKAHSTSNQFGQVPVRERMLTDLARERSVKAEIYVFLLKRQEETSMLIANALPKAEIIDEAYQLSEPAGRGPIFIVAAFLVLGFCMPLGWFMFLKMIRTKFSTREDVDELTSIPVLGEVAVSKSGEKLIVTHHSTNAELFRLMRANLQFILNGSDDKVVLVTSTASGEGKSFISLNLAASLALLDKKVLLIGMDIRKPMLAEYLNLDNNQKGLTQYLSTQGVTLEDVIRKEPNMKNLDVITAGPIPPNPAELLNSALVDDMFDKLREMYDYIIVDTAPVGMVSDTFTLDRIADAAIYVVRVNRTGIKDLDFANTIYEDGRLKKLSLVVNGTIAKKGYGYGYGHTSAD